MQNTLAQRLGLEVAPTQAINYEEMVSPITFEGTLEEILQYVRDGKIKVVRYQGMIQGMHFDSGLSTLEDNLAGQEFQKAFGYKPVMQWVLIAMQLLECGLINEVSEVVDDKYIVIPSIRQIIDLNGNMVVELDQEEVPFSMGSTNMVITSALLDKLEEKLHPVSEEAPAYEDYPSDLTVSLEEVGGTTDAAVKNYLRRRYARCLERGSVPTVAVEDDAVHITNIRWGRKLSRIERERLGI